MKCATQQERHSNTAAGLINKNTHTLVSFKLIKRTRLHQFLRVKPVHAF